MWKSQIGLRPDTDKNRQLPGSLHIFVSLFFVKLPEIGCEIFISIYSVYACFVLLSKKVNKLVCNILVTWSPKATKKQVMKMGWKAQMSWCIND